MWANWVLVLRLPISCHHMTPSGPRLSPGARISTGTIIELDSGSATLSLARQVLCTWGSITGDGDHMLSGRAPALRESPQASPTLEAHTCSSHPWWHPVRSCVCDPQSATPLSPPCSDILWFKEGDRRGADLAVPTWL